MTTLTREQLESFIPVQIDPNNTFVLLKLNTWSIFIDTDMLN
jgi:hypothetical protein